MSFIFSTNKRPESIFEIPYRERDLLLQIYYRRFNISFKYEDALQLVDYDEKRLDRLISGGFIHKFENTISLEDSLLRFMEYFLKDSEEISIADVKELTDILKERINAYLIEEQDSIKNRILSDIILKFRKIGNRLKNNVLALTQLLNSTYSAETDFNKKLVALENLQLKRNSIDELINECKKILNDSLFFSLASRPDVNLVREEMRLSFSETKTGLLFIQQQIILYMRKIEIRRQHITKTLNLKYLKDNHTWEANTNIVDVLGKNNSLYFTPKLTIQTLIPISRLYEEPSLAPLLIEIRPDNLKKKKKEKANRLHLENDIPKTIEASVNIEELWNIFKSQGNNLFDFLLSYLNKKHSEEFMLTTFGIMVTSYFNELKESNETGKYKSIEYLKLYAN